jgi:parvulin-like peptidyl-prolyl isomerase
MAGKDASGASPRFQSNCFQLRFLRVVPAAICIAAVCGPIWNSPAHAQNPVRQTSATAPSSAVQETLPVLAVVNGQQITRDSLAEECLRRYGAEVLESMVSKHIILQACQARQITITQKDIEDEIHNTATKFGLSAANWISLLENERDVDPGQYRRDIVWPTLALRRLASAQTVVTQEEFQRAFDSEYGPKVKALMIVVSSREKAEWLAKTLQSKPDDFAQLAKEHSEDPTTASAYGVIPPIRMHLGDPNLEKIAFSLREDEISPVFQVANQYLLLKCEKQIPRTYISSQQLPQIEEQLKSQISEHKMRVESAELFQQLQSQTQIVKVFGDQKLEAQHPGVAAAIGNQQISRKQLSEECISRHGEDVLDGEINRLLLVQELKRQGKNVEEQDINSEVGRAADAYGFVKTDGSPDVQKWLDTVTEGDTSTIELYVRDAVWPSVALKKLVGEQVTVSQEDLTKGFESNFGERVEVLAIVLNNHRQAQTVWDMARNNPTDQFFGDLANQYSVEPSSRANFGRVPPLRKHSGQPLLEKEAFRLNTGELSGIVAIGDKYVIMRCLGRTQPVVKEFNAVKDELIKDISEKKLRLAMAKEFDRLKDTAQIDNFLAGTSQSGNRPNARTATQPASGTFGPPATQR